eukprot:8885441-Karenia_brevis.AAC.1
MFGGIEGVGADDAWYLTSLEKEYCCLTDCPYVGGSVDLYKCFDQIIRPMLYVVLLFAGLPFQILTPYVNFIANLSIYNSISGSLGSAHQHKCGIPQGCPFSMVFVSLFLRSWIVQMISLGATPRTLADDLLLTTSGGRALHTFVSGFNATITHLQDLGGALAPSKSKLFSTLASHRHWLADYVWDGVVTVIPVVTSMRDLGSHLNIT